MQADETQRPAGESMQDVPRRRPSSESAGHEPAELRLRSVPCRYRAFCAECLLEVTCGTLLIIIVYSDGAFTSSGREITEESLNYLFLASVVSGLKYMALRLMPAAYVGSVGSVPPDLGQISAMSRIAAHRRRIRAMSWGIPVVAAACALLCMTMLLSSETHGIAMAHLLTVLGVNSFVALESSVEAVVGCRRGYREVLPEMEDTVKPVKYCDLVQNPDEGCDAKCAICLQDLLPSETAVRLPCKHVFHAECAGKWMSRGHGCPYRCSRQTLNLNSA